MSSEAEVKGKTNWPRVVVIMVVLILLAQLFDRPGGQILILTEVGILEILLFVLSVAVNAVRYERKKEDDSSLRAKNKKASELLTDSILATVFALVFTLFLLFIS